MREITIPIRVRLFVNEKPSGKKKVGNVTIRAKNETHLSLAYFAVATRFFWTGVKSLMGA